MDWERLDNYETKLFCVLKEELAAGEKRVSYSDIAKRIGCARSTVKYNVGKLLSNGLIGCREGKLYLNTN